VSTVTGAFKLLVPLFQGQQSKWWRIIIVYGYTLSFFWRAEWRKGVWHQSRVKKAEMGERVESESETNIPIRLFSFDEVD
jgi:hypothetical protein